MARVTGFFVEYEKLNIDPAWTLVAEDQPQTCTILFLLKHNTGRVEACSVTYLEVERGNAWRNRVFRWALGHGKMAAKCPWCGHRVFHHLNCARPMHQWMQVVVAGPNSGIVTSSATTTWSDANTDPDEPPPEPLKRHDVQTGPGIRRIDLNEE